MSQNSHIRGRGSSENIPNRFEKISYSKELDDLDFEDPLNPTQYLKDSSQSIISYNDSPDVGFDASINPYRGCEHGCIYCYARPTHEYLGLSSGLDFETKILVKENAARLLRKELKSDKWEPKIIAMSGVTDPYQPIERKLKITRGCLEVLAEFRNPVVIITKNHLITRDMDLLSELAKHQAVSVYISITTLDDSLRRVLEPRTSPPTKRLEAIEMLSSHQIPVGVLVAPVIPALNDHEIPQILQAGATAGAKFAGFVPVRLPHGVSPLFEKWLETHFPDRKEKVLNRIREIRGGKLNDPNFGSRMRGEGVFAKEIAALFAIAKRKAGIQDRGSKLSTTHFRKSKEQFSLF